MGDILSEAQMQVWENADGCISLSSSHPEILKRWTVELEDLPDQPGRWMRYYETSQMDDRRLPSRIECFLDHHDGWSSLVRQGPLQAVVEQLMGELAHLQGERLPTSSTLVEVDSEGTKMHQHSECSVRPITYPR